MKVGQYDTCIAHLNFGKCIYNRNHRRENAVELEFGWRYLKGNSSTYWTVQGGIRNRLGTDYLTCGQCVDTILEHRRGNALVRKVHEAWKKYHLKNWTALTEAEREYLTGLVAEGLASVGKGSCRSARIETNESFRNAQESPTGAER